MSGGICAHKALLDKPPLGAQPAPRREGQVSTKTVSYGEYLSRVHGPLWKPTRMSALIAQRVQSFLESDTGHAYDILIIETPPQHGKSMTVTESLPSWYLGNNPEAGVIIASYDSDFAQRFCRRNREKIRDFGEELFGIRIGKVNRAEELELDGRRGRLISRGIMAGITGNPASLIIIDDPVKNRLEADSETYRDRLWEEWQNSIKSRLCAGGKVILIMTPWHEDDLAGRILKHEKNRELLRLPVEAGENDPMGREPGEPLCPELGKDKAWLEDFKRSYINDARGGQRAWAALYLCTPRTENGNLVKRSWWRFYDPDTAPEPAVELISVDAAFKGGENNDFVSIQVWGKHRQDYYLRYCLNRHLNFPGTLEAIRTAARLYPKARTVLIEDKANGSAVIQVLQRSMCCVGVNPMGGKVARVNAVSAAIESGHVFLPSPEKAPWVADFIEQFSAFPHAAHDDMVDAASQALQRLIYAPGGEDGQEPLACSERDESSYFTDPDILFSPCG